MHTATASRPSPPRTIRVPWVWIAFGILLTFLAASFAQMVGRESDLETQVERTRLLRMSRQAVMEVDVAVLDLIARREQTEISRYFKATNKLARFSEASFPLSMVKNGRDTATLPVIESLKLTWGRILSALQTGNPDMARSIYADYDVSQTMAGFIEAAVTEIEKQDVVQANLQHSIKIAIGVALILVFLIGLLTFRVITHRAARDKRQLEAAIEVANATREAADAASAAANSSREQVSKLFEMTEMLQSAADHQDANAVLRATAAELIPAFGGALYVFSHSRDRLALSAAWNRTSTHELPETIGLQQCWSLKRGKPHVNVPGSHRLCCEHFTGAECVLEIPMIARGEILGLLQIFADGEEGERRLASVESLSSALADGMSLALANIALRDQLRSQALRDPLTSLYNRRYMEDALVRLAGLAEREKTELSVIMIDLDQFKRLNDNHGHAKGDAVLRDAASILINQIRETDIACRYGGEELIVVLPSCGLDRAVAKAEQLRIAIEAMSEPNGVQVSASMGVATIPTTSVAPRDMLATADAALYQAKQQGRNRVVAASKLEGRTTAGRPEPRIIDLVAAE